MSDALDTMAPVVQRVRAYFAPVNRTAATATIFDPAQNGAFPLDTPAAPWTDLGWIGNFTRHCGTRIEPLRSGAPAAAMLQTRTEVEATVSFAFETWGKLQLALSAGFQQLNLLAPASGAAPAGSGGAALPAVPLLAGSTATALQLGPAAAPFSPGGLVAVDVDYAGTTGWLGSGISGAYVKAALSDVDYIRRITLNVARIASINSGALQLESPLLAGTPTAAMKVSSLTGFCDREGSSFFQEWSALFIAPGQQGERVLWHYPRLQSMQGAAEANANDPGQYDRIRLSAAFRALPVKDPVDGETVLCFRSYII
jgi:hypothetical protein